MTSKVCHKMAVVTSSIHHTSRLGRPSQRHRRTRTKLPNAVSRKSSMHLSFKTYTEAQPALEKEDALLKPLSAIITAYQALDNSISGTSSPVTDAMAYLTSSDLILRWETDLNCLIERFLVGHFTPEMFEKRLQTILLDVEKLERLRDAMDNEGIEDGLREAVNGKCRMLEEVFGAMERRLE